MTAQTPLSALLEGRIAGSGSVQFDIPEDWLQGRTTFGGLIAVLAVQAMRDIAGAHWPAGVRLRALQTSFIGPIGKGSVQVVVQVLREGKNVRQVQALVRQGEDTGAVLLGMFGNDRETALPVLAPEQPKVALSPEQAMPVPFLPGVVPNFIQHMDMRWAEGGLPFSGSNDWHNRIHLRLKHAGDVINTELLAVLLADAPPSPVIGRFSRPTPASSVSWELELLPIDSSPEAASGFWRVDTDALAATGGYVNEVSRLWTPSGRLASLGYQVVAAYG